MINKKTRIKIMAQLLTITSTLGIGVGYSFITNESIQVNALESSDFAYGFTNISVGSGHQMFLKSDGTILGTGDNSYGQLGIGNKNYQTAPVKVPITNVKKVICGDGFTMFIKNDGTVWGTGKNYFGQLGIGNTTDQLSPIQIPITDVKDVVSGPNGVNHTIFIKNDGTVWATGQNAYGQLGIGNTTQQNSPVQIPITNVKEVSCGDMDTIFIKNDGTVWGVGGNSTGELGLGNATTQKTPVQIPISNVKKVSFGYMHSVFLKNDGTVLSFGANNYGQLGSGTISTNASISAIQTLITDVKDVVCGGYNTMFIKNDSTVWGVGQNDSGQLSVGNNTNQALPVKSIITNIKNVFCSSLNIFVTNDGNVLRNISGGVKSISSTLLYNTNYTLDKVYNNLSSYGYYGSLSTFVYSKSKFDDNKPVSYKNESSTTLGNIVVEDSELRLKEILPNGSAVTVDNYGSVQFYSNLSATATNIAVDGTTISKIDYGMVGSTPVVMFYKNDGSVWYFDPTGTTISLKMLPISQSDFTKTSVYQDKNALAKFFLFQKTDGSLVYFDSNRFEISTGINVNDVMQVIPSTTNNSTMYLMKDGTIKYINTSGQATNVTLPTGLSVQSLLSNRFITLSDGFIYALNNNSMVATNVLATATQSATNNILWMKNGTMQTLSTSGTISTLTAVNGKLVKSIVSFDNNNAYILNLDDTTYGVGNLISTTDLKNKNIDYSNIAGFISNNDNSTDSKLLVMKDGTVYTNPSSWTNSTQIRFDGSALTQVQQTMAVSFDTLAQATNAVVTAETTKTQVDLDYARGLVNALPDSTNKTALISRLDALQLIINASSQINVATQAVAKAENTKLQADIDLAQTEVNKLPDGTDKTALQVRLDAIKNAIALTNATQAVVKAEGSKTQADVDSARTLVNTLPDGTDKTDLTKRLDAIQTIINNQTQANADLLDAQTKVSKAESTKTQADIDIAQTAINKLPSGTDKTNLQTRLDKVKTDLATNDTAKLKETQDAVAKAETTKTQADVDSARTLVSTLPTGTDKTDLTKRLDVIQAEINKTKQDALDAQKLKDAQDAVTKADTTKTQPDLTKAQTSVNTLPNGTEKTNLQSILDKIKQEIADKAKQDAYNNQLAQATALVTTAEGTKDTYDILKAQSAVSSLPSGSDKDTLQSRLDALKVQKAKDDQIVADTKEATLKVQIAEASVNLSSVKTYIANAQTAIDKLPSCAEKTALQDRLNKITIQISINANKSLAMQAEPLVKFAELYKTTTYKNKAWAVVNQMTDSDAKTNFVNRLNAIK